MSIPSDDPRRTAHFFAALIDGDVFDFPPVVGAAIAVARDGSGVAVEVYPVGMAHHPGEGEPMPIEVPADPAAMPWEDQIFPEPMDRSPSSFHLAIETRRTRDEVIALARTRGWRTVVCDRAGVFGVIEVWIDDRVLVEALTREESERYRRFMNPRGCAEMFGPALPSTE